MTVTYGEYLKEQATFAQKHNQKSECKIYTSMMGNNRYHKEYCWEDGANWYEVTELITEEKEVEAHGLTFKVRIQYWKTEYWTSESGSKYFYEKA